MRSLSLRTILRFFGATVLYVSLQWLSPVPVSAQTIYNWNGTTSTAWNTAANWTVGGVVSSVVPDAGDAVRIGVDAAINITNNPVVTDTRSCASVVFGARPANALTVNGTLNVSGNITVNHGSTATGSGGSPPSPTPTYKTVLAGTGTINVAGSVIHGDNTYPPAGANARVMNELSVDLANLNISGNIVLVANLLNNTFAVNGPQFLHRSGTLKLTGQFDRQINGGTYAEALNDAKNSVVGYFATDQDAGNTQLILENLNAIRSQVNGIGIDFTNNGSGTATLVYRNNSASAQTVYPGNGISIGEDLANYQNIVFEGTGPKLVYPNAYNNSFPVTINGSWTSSGGRIDLTTNSTVIQFEGGTNSNITDNGSDGGRGVVFRVVRFTEGGTKTISSGRFAVAANGTLTVTETAATQNTQLAANGNLTLLSGPESSATVLPIANGCTITGNVNVQRFVKGSSDLTKRGYRLISSAVNTATPSIDGTPVRTFDPNYLLNSAWVSGLAGGGFNTANGNPTLYLYREDLVPTGVTFTSSNYKGIAGLSTVSPFAVRTQFRNRSTYVSDTTVNIPVGTGMLFFFRGDQTNNSSQTGSKLTAPFDHPEDVTLTSTGILNQGTVNVRSWYAQADQTKLSYTENIANNIAPRNVRGYHLLGNPYPSSINWNKTNRNSTLVNSSIYASALDGPTVWFFNPINKQYASYLPATNADTANTVVTQGTNGASNIIASGQGFFVRASAAGGVFRFMEAAKTVSQPPPASLNRLMGIPASSVAGMQPYMRLQMKKDSVNDDDILIRFDAAYSDDYNPAEDAEDMGGNGALLSLSALSAKKNVRISINGVPGFDRVKKVPLFVDATASGLYELNRLELEGMPAIYQVWLKDAFTKDSIDFRANKSYTFRIDRNLPATWGDDRFSLLFRRGPMPPYELLSFTARKEGNGVLLQWKVLNEFNYTDFTLQKANGLLDFAAIGHIQSNGKGIYTYFDAHPNGDTMAYRILQNKPDGKDVFSPVIVIKNTPQKQFILYPNPASDYLTVELDKTTTAKLKITDAKGRNVYHTSFTGKSVRINLSGLKAGTYFIDVTDTTSFKILGGAKWIKL